MRKFPFRGYEFHSLRLWQQGQVDSALEFMKKEGLNALIFHQNDLVDQLVFPEKYYSNDILWERWPTRRQGVLYHRVYTRRDPKSKRDGDRILHGSERNQRHGFYF